MVRDVIPTKPQARAWWRQPEWWLRFAAYAMPACFLVYVLYWNFLPFGYDAAYTIAVGAPNDTTGEFRLKPSKDLSAPMIAADGSTYRQLNGLAYAVFEPRAVLKNARITVSVEGDSVSLILPRLDFDLSSVNWNYSWDFEHDEYESPPNPYFITAPSGFLASSSAPAATSSGLTGSAFRFDNYESFDGTSRLELPDSQDLFENGPFTVYAEWTPEDPNDDFQEIVGHFNWELLQDSKDVKFFVGRMNNSSGGFYSITYPTDSSFFNERHTALAVYSPSATSSEEGFIELYVDGAFVDRMDIGTSTIWQDYNGSRNLSLGLAGHDSARPFKGKLYHLAISNQDVIGSQKAFSFTTDDQLNEFPIVSNGAGILQTLYLSVQRK